MKMLIRMTVMGAVLFGAIVLKVQNSYAEEQTASAGTQAAQPSSQTGEAKSIGTQAGETARDMKSQFEAASKRLQESAQAFTEWAQEEWRKFNQAMNQPAKT